MAPSVSRVPTLNPASRIGFAKVVGAQSLLVAIGCIFALVSEGFEVLVLLVQRFLTCGLNDPFFHRVCLRPSENTGIYIMIHNSSKIIVMK